METYNQELLVELINAAKGTRSMRQYAIDAGLNPATLNLIVNGKRKANINHIAKLASPAANPQGGVRVNELCDACGYIVLTVPEEALNYDEKFNHQKELEVIGTGLIHTTLKEKEYRYEITTSDTKSYNPHLSIKVKELEQNWYFQIESFLNYDESELIEKMQMVLTDIFIAGIDMNRMITIMVDTNTAYEEFESLEGHLAYKGNLSVVLLNRETMKLEKEKVIATYDEDGAKVRKLI